ncbi:hypothetical protein VNI00_008060 [Paramarasmius palmivorus]|uniref:F-box domain-containing protein n=1 Tax=Paramarasmius palmivorus TaxID=297713 RepID=A0AAW0D0W6_9AGAR
MARQQPSEGDPPDMHCRLPRELVDHILRLAGENNPRELMRSFGFVCTVWREMAVQHFLQMEPVQIQLGDTETFNQVVEVARRNNALLPLSRHLIVSLDPEEAMSAGAPEAHITELGRILQGTRDLRSLVIETDTKIGCENLLRCSDLTNLLGGERQPNLTVLHLHLAVEIGETLIPLISSFRNLQVLGVNTVYLDVAADHDGISGPLDLTQYTLSQALRSFNISILRFSSRAVSMFTNWLSMHRPLALDHAAIYTEQTRRIVSAAENLSQAKALFIGFSEDEPYETEVASGLYWYELSNFTKLEHLKIHIALSLPGNTHDAFAALLPIIRRTISTLRSDKLRKIDFIVEWDHLLWDTAPWRQLASELATTDGLRSVEVKVIVKVTMPAVAYIANPDTAQRHVEDIFSPRKLDVVSEVDDLGDRSLCFDEMYGWH